MSLGKHNASLKTSLRLTLCQAGEFALGTEDDRRRFWAKAHISSQWDCWPWTGSMGTNGYGQFMWSSRFGRTVPQGAHRCAWEMTRGAIPEGGHVLHSCDNRACVNPAHLFLGDHLANMRDAAAKGRLHAPRPSRQKVPDSAIPDILNRLRTGTPQYVIAREFGVSKGWVSRLYHGDLRQYARAVAQQKAS